MRINKSFNFIPLCFAFFSSAIFASTTVSTPSTHILVAPHCITQLPNIPFSTLYQNDKFSLVSISDQAFSKLLQSKEEKKKLCAGFIDVTATWQAYTIKDTANAKKLLTAYSNYHPTPVSSTPYQIRYESEVNALLPNIDMTYFIDRLKSLTSYADRYANSNNGVKAVNEIKDEIEALAKAYNRTDVKAYLVNTSASYKQPSLVVKLGNSNTPGIVIGGHIDTLSSSVSKKPGADDDGSGSVTVLHTLRTLISNNMSFKKPIYFIWYAAEEMGLVGSGVVVKDFKNKKIPVEAAIQFDMTGYSKNSKGSDDLTMWLINDYVNPELTNYLETLIQTYVHRPVQRTKCGYACSDHASWYYGGFKASMPFESSFEKDNPNVHTYRDTIDLLSKEHMKDYAALALAFAVEMAEPVTL